MQPAKAISLRYFLLGKRAKERYEVTNLRYQCLLNWLWIREGREVDKAIAREIVESLFQRASTEVPVCTRCGDTPSYTITGKPYCDDCTRELAS